MCWFDSVAAGDGKNSGVGGILSIAHNHFIKWTFNSGVGTNNRAELLGIWTTLLLAKFLNLQTLVIFGDSKLVINWCNGKGSLCSLALEGWKARIQELRCHFNSLSFHHTYRDFNKAADTLSKKALQDCLHVRNDFLYSVGGQQSRLNKNHSCFLTSLYGPGPPFRAA
jgi:ribonuclease HI